MASSPPDLTQSNTNSSDWLWLATGLIVGALALSLWFPAAAWPEWQTMTGVMILSALLLTIPQPASKVGSGLDRRQLLPLAVFGAYVLLLGVGLSWAPVFASGRGSVVNHLLAFGAFASLVLIPRASADRMVPWLLPALALMMTLQAVLGFVQVWGPASVPMTFAAKEQAILTYVAESDPLREGLLHAVRSGRASGSMGAPNIFASFVAVGFVLSLGLSWLAKSPAARWSWGLAALACGGAVLLSQSRGGVLGVMTGSIALFVCIVARTMERRRAMQLAGGLVGMVMLGALVLLGVLLWLDLQHHRWLGTAGLTIRLAYWKSALGMWQESPILGNGPGAFEVLYPAHRLAGVDETRFAHSWFFEALVTTGLLGVGLLMSGLLLVLNSMRQQLRGNRNNREVALVLVAAAAGAAMLGHGLLEYTLSTFEGALLLAILGGTILGAQDRVEGRLKVKPWMVVALLLPIMGVGFWKLGLEPQRAARLREEASLALTTPLDPQRGVALATQSIAIDPWHPAGYELRARLDQRLGGTRFLADMTRARELQPRSGRLAQELALYHAERGQWAEALKLQEEAIALHPLNLGHRLTYARLLASSGRLDDARTAWRQALDVKAFRDSEVYLRMAVGRELGLEEELPPLPLHLRGR